MTVGEKIKSYRKDKLGKKVSQQELADAINVERSHISNWETNKARPNVSNAIAVAKFFNVDVSELLNEEEQEMTKASPGDPHNPELALLIALLDECAINKAKTDGISYEDALSGIQKKSSLILRNLDAWRHLFQGISFSS